MTKKELWLSKHSEELEAHTGKYVAVVDEVVVAVSPDPGEAIREAKKSYPDKTSLLIYVPKEKELEMLI